MSETQLPSAGLAAYLAPVWTGEQPLRLLHRTPPGGPPERIAEGFERLEPVTAAVAGHRECWQARRLVIRSGPLAHAGVRVLTRLEFGGRQRLATAKTPWAGRYVGNPKRATAHPTAERLLEALQGLTLPLIREGRRRRSHLTPLCRVPRRILARLDCPDDISTRLGPDSHQPPSK